MVQGHLRAQGINVQRSRIRSTFSDVDPEGVEARRRLRIHRRSLRFVLHHGADFLGIIEQKLSCNYLGKQPKDMASH